MTRTDPLHKLWDILRAESGPKRLRAIDAWGARWARDGDLSSHWLATTSAVALLKIFAQTGDRPRLVRAACACARAAVPMLLPDNRAPVKAIETAEAWARGEATVNAVEAARRKVIVPELRESKTHRRTVYAPASARAAAWVATVIERPRRVTAAGYAENAAENAAFALEGPAKRHLARARLADLVRRELTCPAFEEILRR